MKAFSDFFAALFSNRLAERAVLIISLALFAIGNLPWHLDNYDQAKQAYVPYQIAHGASWWYQETPRGKAASKPPLAGWAALAVQAVTRSWDLALRLPGFLCAIVLLVLLRKEAAKVLPEGGAFLATAAFGLNLLTPRIATLVRTDMLLSALIAICGLLIYRKISSGEPWTRKEQWTFFLAMLAAFFTKGPILYAFLLPGMAAFWFIERDNPHLRKQVWSGWWTWLVPLAAFLIWLIAGCLTIEGFAQDVVVMEFFSRFDQSLKSNERQQPLWFYFPHLVHKFLPWSVLLLALALWSKNVREKIRRDPGTLWLVCWALGGLLCMTFVPSKRVDRIYPVIPPLCLLLPAMVAACQCGQRVRAWCGAAIAASLAIAVGYFLTIVVVGYREDAAALPRFGLEVQAAATKAGITEIGVGEGRDEGMIMYCGADRFLTPRRVIRRWQNGTLDAAVLPANEAPPDFGAPLLSVGPVAGRKESHYFLFLRAPTQ